MSSPMPPLPPDFERAVGAAYRRRVRTVAERCFFACADRANAPDLDDVRAEWRVARHFDDGRCGDRCVLAPQRSGALCSTSSSTRSLPTPLPPRHQVDDRLQFSNMVAAWLTAARRHRVFRSVPRVEPRP